MLAQRIFAREILLRQLVADDDRLRPADAIVTGKEASVQQWYLQCAEISGIGSSGRARRASAVPGVIGGCSGIVKASSPPLAPAPGTIDPSAAARTPGMARTRSSSVSLNAFTFSGLSYFFAGKAVAHRQHVVRHAAHIRRPQIARSS